ncbi:hypothetical protein [Stigmatella hybrida]|uniref:hypothetical protein n=1 Tax=Stigmatella hybrida TaxID=394097 RepID=UPI001CDB3B31|nr:hypothetical protein [Stigmatella hybrida]
MSRSRKAWWDEIAQDRDALVLLLNYAEAPFEVTVLAHKDFERKCLREARTPAERLHIQRLSAKDILVEAYAGAQPWKDFGPPLLRLKRLGFPDTRTHVLAACLYVQALTLFPERVRDAFALLEDAERRVRRMPKTSRGREQLLDGITDARRVAEMQGIRPPQAGRG